MKPFIASRAILFSITCMQCLGSNAAKSTDKRIAVRYSHVRLLSGAVEEDIVDLLQTRTNISHHAANMEAKRDALQKTEDEDESKDESESQDEAADEDSSENDDGSEVEADLDEAEEDAKAESEMAKGQYLDNSLMTVEKKSNHVQGSMAQDVADDLHLYVPNSQPQNMLAATTSEACGDVLSALNPECWEELALSQRNFSRTIWMYWEGPQPPFLQMVVKSWRNLNPHYKVLLLNKTTVENYLPFEAIQGRLAINVSIAHRVDLLRIFLLAKYGGVWTDSSVFCWKPLDDSDFLPTMLRQGYWMPKMKGGDLDRQVNNYFIVAKPRDETIMTQLRYMKEYLFRPRAHPLRPVGPTLGKALRGASGLSNFGVPKELVGKTVTDSLLLKHLEARGQWPYFYFHYLFNAVLHDNSHLQATWDNESWIPGICVHHWESSCKITKFSRHNSAWVKAYEQRRQLQIDKWMTPIFIKPVESSPHVA